MEPTGIQQLFFNHLKSKLPANISLVDEIASRLNISNDSAYRRIRGEKPISFEELKDLCLHYRISLDSFIHSGSDSVLFEGKINNGTEDVFEEWLQNVLLQLQYFNRFSRKHVTFLMKDIPPYVHFLIPELARFKVFFWMKSILHYKSLNGVKYSLHDKTYEKYESIAKKITELYLKIPMTEIWNVESIESTLRQIDFYHDAGSFDDPALAAMLYDKVQQLINHLESQAEHGVKFAIGQEPNEQCSEYRVYLNELILGDNTILAELDNNRISFLNYGVLFVVHTRDERFNTAISDNLANIIRKSAMISRSGERERVRFFNQLRERINFYRAKR